jgi:hypothetical protein
LLPNMATVMSMTVLISTRRLSSCVSPAKAVLSA